MSKNSLPSAHENGRTFGDTENMVTRSLWYYLWGVVRKPNSIASELSNDSNLYRLGWKVALLLLFFELVCGYFIEQYAYANGFITLDESNENLGYLLFSAPLYIGTYFILRFILVFVLRFGTDFSDKRVAAASASIVGNNIWFVILAYPMYAAMYVLPSSYWYLGSTAYENASGMVLCIIIPISIGYSVFYFKDVFKLKTVNAVLWVLASMFLFIIISLVVIFFIAFAFNLVIPE